MQGRRPRGLQSVGRVAAAREEAAPARNHGGSCPWAVKKPSVTIFAPIGSIHVEAVCSGVHMHVTDGLQRTEQRTFCTGASGCSPVVYGRQVAPSRALLL